MYRYVSEANNDSNAQSMSTVGGVGCRAFSSQGFTLILSEDLPPWRYAKMARTFNTWNAEGYYHQEVQRNLDANWNKNAPAAKRLVAIQGLKFYNPNSRVSFVADVAIVKKTDLDGIRGAAGNESQGISMDVLRPFAIFDMSSRRQTAASQIKELLKCAQGYQDVACIHVAAEQNLGLLVNTERLYYIPANLNRPVDQILTNREYFYSVRDPNSMNVDLGHNTAPPGTQALGVGFNFQSGNLGPVHINIDLLSLLRKKKGDPNWVPQPGVIHAQGNVGAAGVAARGGRGGGQGARGGAGGRGGQRAARGGGAQQATNQKKRKRATGTQTGPKSKRGKKT
eukprot:TRINITY_DN3398_c0_g1_i5.p1 TRINITY_DN3398_c0_g1~~TRINITY_DN3398_c0_g1_i5.p1  ORF type:complete len:339 (+),score=44.15 TRINITY_DN3398_c0_g1_i5:472-1488(+)